MEVTRGIRPGSESLASSNSGIPSGSLRGVKGKGGVVVVQQQQQMGNKFIQF